MRSLCTGHHHENTQRRGAGCGFFGAFRGWHLYRIETKGLWEWITIIGYVDDWFTDGFHDFVEVVVISVGQDKFSSCFENHFRMKESRSSGSEIKLLNWQRDKNDSRLFIVERISVVDDCTLSPNTFFWLGVVLNLWFFGDVGWARRSKCQVIKPQGRRWPQKFALKQSTSFNISRDDCQRDS